MSGESFYRQVKEPDTTETRVPGNCLGLVVGSVDAPGRGETYSAMDSFNASPTQHGPDVPLPSGATWVPIYFHWTGWAGYSGNEVYKDWGHVVWANLDGNGNVLRILSSPITNGVAGVPGQQWLPSIQSVINCFTSASKVSYAGWTEDVNGVPVIEPAAATPSSSPIGKDLDMLVISSPTTLANGGQVRCDQSGAKPIDNATALVLRGNGVPYHDCQTDQELMTVAGQFWDAAGLDQTATAAKVADLLKAKP